MNSIAAQLRLERFGPEEATVGMISLPLPREQAGWLGIDHPRAGMQPVGWWVLNQLPRRALAFVVDDAGVPPTLRLADRAAATPAPHEQSAAPWTIGTRIAKEKLDFTPHKFADIASLRGVPAHECTTVEFELLLGFGPRTLALQFGATGPKGGPYFWQNVQVDPLWKNAAVQAVRVGGVVYNEDTYLWADLYLLLFANGVAHAAAHFVNTKLHVEGYDFHGLPLVRLAGDGLTPLTASLPADGARFDLGAVRLNLADAAHLTSPEHPGRLSGGDAQVIWTPVSRTFNPQSESSPETEWAPGFARTVRFQFSLSDAVPVVARYRAPAWWYAACGEPWPQGYLPVRGRNGRLGELTADHIRGLMKRGRFDSPNAGFGNDGDAGVGILQNYYHTGRPDLLRDGLDYCYYWADLAVDHRDFTVHQWVGGWGWKTCAYTKFRDVLYGYLETGDPYLLDTAEMTAEAYWTWFRTNWPRCTIGRDSFEVGGWALMWRFLRTEHARERTRELVRMMETVLDSRGTIGGQMGAGPHPGYLSSLYMTGVSMLSLLEAAEAEAEEGNAAEIARLLASVRKMHAHYDRDDLELFPSHSGTVRQTWEPLQHSIWAAIAMRVYPEIARMQGAEDTISARGLGRVPEHAPPTLEQWAGLGRLGNQLVNPLYHDALVLGARVDGEAVEIAPLGAPQSWPEVQEVDTPFGLLKVITTPEADSAVRVRFESAGGDFPVVFRYGGEAHRTISNGSCRLRANTSLPTD